MSVTYTFGAELKELPEEKKKELGHFLNYEWGSMLWVNTKIIEERLNSGELAVVLETMAIKYPRAAIPEDATYHRLTDNGSFKNLYYNEGVDILLLMDLTVKSGFGKKFLEDAKLILAKETDIENIFSYSPDISKVRSWHQNMGAETTPFKVINGRPNYSPTKPLSPGDKPEDVIALSYNKEIEKIRRKLGIIKPEIPSMPSLEELILSPNEIKAIKLHDLKELSISHAARTMDIPKQSYESLLRSARRKIAEHVVYGKPLQIQR